ncbi:MAG: SAM-dependent methyltransferase [Chitinophagaceae bacterium]
MPQLPKDLFSEHAELYARYRPLYPKQLFDFILQHVKHKNKALDCGTGNGQAAGALADYFKEVHGTDISQKQIERAIAKPNMTYHLTVAEKLPFKANEFDLVTAATSLHWFHIDKFYEEVNRVAKNNAVFATWAYNVLQTHNDKINELIQDFYHNIIYSYWNAERKYVDQEYKTIPFPFSEIKNPGFATRLQWDFETLEGYLNTWSAVQKFIKQNAYNPVDDLIKKMKSIVGEKTMMQVSFPVFMRIGIIKK